MVVLCCKGTTKVGNYQTFSFFSLTSSHGMTAMQLQFDT